MWGTKGQEVEVRGQKAGWGEGWARTRVGVPSGAVTSWRVKLSEEDGGMVHYVGVVSDSFAEWDGEGMPEGEGNEGYWAAQNDRVWACGEELETEHNFNEGDTVTLKLDRQARTLTVVGSQRTVTIRDLPATGVLYPAVGFCNAAQHSELLDYAPDSAGTDPEAGAGCQHENVRKQCMVCTNCLECTGYGSSCVRHKPGRAAGQECGCGGGKSGCTQCGLCEKCQRKGAIIKKGIRLSVGDMVKLTNNYADFGDAECGPLKPGVFLEFRHYHMIVLNNSSLLTM
jgi:hypothetical protein